MWHIQTFYRIYRIIYMNLKAQRTHEIVETMSRQHFITFYVVHVVTSTKR